MSELPQVAHRFGVRGVPVTSIDDRVTVVGALPEGRPLEKVLAARFSAVGIAPEVRLLDPCQYPVAGPRAA